MLFPLSSERAFLFLHNTFAYWTLSNVNELDEKMKMGVRKTEKNLQYIGKGQFFVIETFGMVLS